MKKIKKFAFQCIGYIWLYDREGNKTQCVQVQWQKNCRPDDPSYVKRRKESRFLGVHFKQEEDYIQSLRFAETNPTSGLSKEQAEKDYQQQVNEFLNQSESMACYLPETPIAVQRTTTHEPTYEFYCPKPIRAETSGYFTNQPVCA